MLCICLGCTFAFLIGGIVMASISSKETKRKCHLCGQTIRSQKCDRSGFENVFFLRFLLCHCKHNRRKTFYSYSCLKKVSGYSIQYQYRNTVNLHPYGEYTIV